MRTFALKPRAEAPERLTLDPKQPPSDAVSKGSHPVQAIHMLTFVQVPNRR